jgi:hypothetical protein
MQSLPLCSGRGHPRGTFPSYGGNLGRTLSQSPRQKSKHCRGPRAHGARSVSGPFDAGNASTEPDRVLLAASIVESDRTKYRLEALALCIWASPSEVANP